MEQARRRPPSGAAGRPANRKGARKGRRWKLRGRGVMLLLGFAAAIGVGVYVVVVSSAVRGAQSVFAGGIRVDGVPVGGYTRAQAEAVLGLDTNRRLEKIDITVDCDGRMWHIAAADVGARFDTQSLLDQAWTLGHEGGLLEKYGELRAVRREGWDARSELRVDEGRLESIVRGIVGEINEPATEATLAFDPSEDDLFIITPAAAGREVTYEDLYERILTAVREMDSGAIRIQPDIVQPKTLEEDLSAFTARLSYVTTPLNDSSDARIHNIRLAAAFFNGMRVDPGQTVSFNETTGPRELENGYQNAGVILDDEIVDGAGGGVCQVSTTLYQALVRAGIRIDTRRKHSLPVSYVDVGADAAVSYGNKDLIFTNQTDGPVFLKVTVSGGKVRASVFGKALPGEAEIRLETVVLEKIDAPEPELRQDTKAEYVKHVGETFVLKRSRAGYKVESFAVTYIGGEEVARTRLTSDYYKEVTGVTYVGVQSRASDPASAGSSAPSHRQETDD